MQYFFIMKNLFSNLGAFCSGLLVCVAVIACANDTDDNTSNSIEVLSRQIAELAGRITLVEKNLQQSALPKVLSSESYEKEVWDGESSISKSVADYEFDKQGRIIKITEHCIEGKDAGMSDVANVTYEENKCTIESVSGEYVKTTRRLTFTFDDDDISNIAAVNNLIVSAVTNMQ